MTRTELIHSLTQPETEEGEFISKSVRGNTLWTLWKKDSYYIVSYQLRGKGSNDWTYDREIESTPPSTCTCPKKYLTLATEVCKDWRSTCREYETKRKGSKSLIRELFENKRKEQKLQVTLTAKKGYAIRLHDYALENAILYIVSVWPGIEGRFPQNGLRYEIPLRLVTDAKLIDPEETDHGKQSQVTESTNGGT